MKKKRNARKIINNMIQKSEQNEIEKERLLAPKRFEEHNYNMIQSDLDTGDLIDDLKKRSVLDRVEMDNIP